MPETSGLGRVTVEILFSTSLVAIDVTGAIPPILRSAFCYVLGRAEPRLGGGVRTHPLR